MARCRGPRAGTRPRLSARPMSSAKASFSPPPRETVSKRRTRESEEPCAPLVTERLPAKTLLYQSMTVLDHSQDNQRRVATALVGVAAAASSDSSADDDPDGADADSQPAKSRPAPTSGEPLMLAPPSATRGGLRVREYQLLRAVHLARGPVTATDASLESNGLDGWRSADGKQLALLDPTTLLQLVDDDKQARLVQAFLPDMFCRLGLSDRSTSSGRSTMDRDTALS